MRANPLQNKARAVVTSCVFKQIKDHKLGTAAWYSQHCFPEVLQPLRIKGYLAFNSLRPWSDIWRITAAHPLVPHKMSENSGGPVSPPSPHFSIHHPTSRYITPFLSASKSYSYLGVGNTLATPAKLRVSMGSGNRLHLVDDICRAPAPPHGVVDISGRRNSLGADLVA
ncbi:hypothetical protein EVAR_67797_1 [Eumeta japonica]|uniref:Uncharacterized protein n=1 Tax=Eumeta variegata TaxID=151549 RepID=A0A4C2A145_EUMVA|nr:hypothetical protein EVAR_67797_1 [Eumeta japonica]